MWSKCGSLHCVIIVSFAEVDVAESFTYFNILWNNFSHTVQHHSFVWSAWMGLVYGMGPISNDIFLKTEKGREQRVVFVLRELWLVFLTHLLLIAVGTQNLLRAVTLGISNTDSGRTHWKIRNPWKWCCPQKAKYVITIGLGFVSEMMAKWLDSQWDRDKMCQWRWLWGRGIPLVNSSSCKYSDFSLTSSSAKAVYHCPFPHTSQAKLETKCWPSAGLG